MTAARRLALLTQRVDIVPRYGERRDCIDQEWVRLLDEVGYDAVCCPNHAAVAVALARRLRPDALILTGGNGVLPEQPGYMAERNATESALLEWAAGEKVAVLGVCRGFQFMNVHLGGALRKVEGHVAKAHEIKFPGGNVRVANSYHDFGMLPQDLATDLEAEAAAPDGTIEAAQHRRLPWIGVMWHPERKMPDPAGVRRWLARLLSRPLDKRIEFDRD